MRSNSVNILPLKVRFRAQAKSLKSSWINPTPDNSQESGICENYDNMDMPDGMKVIFVSADIGQWNKTLDNVLDGLPQAMAENGHKVMVVTPMYGHRDAWDTGYRAEYGTLPVVSCTGGLMDTVADGITSFHMRRVSIKHNEVNPSDALQVATTLKRAVKVMGTPLHKRMVQNCMALDLSWKGPRKEWERVLTSLRVEGKESGIDVEEIPPLAEKPKGNI